MVSVSKIMNQLQVNNNHVVDVNNKQVDFLISDCRIIEVCDTSFKITSKNVDKLFPMFTFERNQNLESSFSLEKHGMCLTIFTNTRNFKDIISLEGHYNIECRINSIIDSHLTCKVLRIIDVAESSEDIDADIAEPDNQDVEEIRQNIAQKIKKLKKKYLEISKYQIQAMSLTELISLEDNLYDFFQNNI